MSRLEAGIDEAGRGCLAGPVAAAAVILRPDGMIAGLADSKVLSPAKREKLAILIKRDALAWSVALVWQRRIDEINILNATLEAMARAARLLKTPPARLLIDGNRLIPAEILGREWRKSFLNPLPDQKALVHGDSFQPAISAASILAKTFRDKLMAAFDRRWPAYNFKKHKGYGTSEHLAVLRDRGPCPLHRMTFRGVLRDSLARLPGI